LSPANQNRAWQPSKLQKRVDEITRRAADTEAARIPWRQLLQTRELYVKWQAFLLWVRVIEDSEGSVPQWLAELVNRRCPGLVRFAQQQTANERGKSSPIWHHLEEWINGRVFSKPRQEGWMDAVGYYAVRDLAALRDEAYWYYCDGQWKLSKPAVYPSFREWRKASEQCREEVVDHFETTDELRDLIKLSRQVSPRTLKKTVDYYVEWRVFAYWARAALDLEHRSPDFAKHELERRCPGFLKTLALPKANGRKESEDHFRRLLHWIEKHEFTRAYSEGWLPVLAYQARLHPRLQRVADYWHHWQRLRSENAGSRYPSLDQWKLAADTYTFEPQDG
jgi:hypothetical protein